MREDITYGLGLLVKMLIMALPMRKYVIYGLSQFVNMLDKTIVNESDFIYIASLFSTIDWILSELIVYGK